MFSLLDLNQVILTFTTSFISIKRNLLHLLSDLAVVTRAEGHGCKHRQSQAVRIGFKAFEACHDTESSSIISMNHLICEWSTKYGNGNTWHITTHRRFGEEKKDTHLTKSLDPNLQQEHSPPKRVYVLERAREKGKKEMTQKCERENALYITYPIGVYIVHQMKRLHNVTVTKKTVTKE